MVNKLFEKHRFLWRTSLRKRLKGFKEKAREKEESDYHIYIPSDFWNRLMLEIFCFGYNVYLIANSSIEIHFKVFNRCVSVFPLMQTFSPVRDRPFNLQEGCVCVGGGVWGGFFRSEIFFRTSQNINFFLWRKARFFSRI